MFLLLFGSTQTTKANQNVSRNIPVTMVSGANYVLCGHFGVPLTHRGRDHMAIILQTTFSHPFSCVNLTVFRLKFHWNVFPLVQLTVGLYTLLSHYLNQWWPRLVTHIFDTWFGWVHSIIEYFIHVCICRDALVYMNVCICFCPRVCVYIWVCTWIHVCEYRYECCLRKFLHNYCPFVILLCWLLYCPAFN